MAMVMRKHARELAEFLRSEYNADHFEMQRGGKHPKLKFRCHGSEFSYVVGSPGDVRAIRNIEADLKRMLGPPHSAKPKTIEPQEEAEVMKIIEEQQCEEIEMAYTTPPSPYYKKPTTRLQPVPDSPPDPVLPDPVLPDPVSPDPVPPDLTPHALIHEHPAARTWEIKVCAYHHKKEGREGHGGNPVVWFLFPKAATDFINKNYYREMLDIERLDNEHWKISINRNGKSRFTSFENNRVKLTYTDKTIEPFGSTNAEAVEANGEILIYLAEEARRPIAPHVIYTKTNPKPKLVPPIRLKIDPVPPIDPPPVQYAKVTMQQPMLMTTSTLMEQRMLDIIRQVYDIQDLCPYKLVVLPDGRLTWRAPEIG